MFDLTQHLRVVHADSSNHYGDKRILGNPDPKEQERLEAYLYQHGVWYCKEHGTFNNTRSCKVRKTSGVAPHRYQTCSHCGPKRKPPVYVPPSLLMFPNKIRTVLETATMDRKSKLENKRKPSTRATSRVPCSTIHASGCIAFSRTARGFIDPSDPKSWLSPVPLMLLEEMPLEIPGFPLSQCSTTELKTVRQLMQHYRNVHTARSKR